MAKQTFRALLLRQNKIFAVICLDVGLTRRSIDLLKFQLISIEVLRFAVGATRKCSETIFSLVAVLQPEENNYWGSVHD